MSRAGKHALMEQLIADGVRYVFGNPGTTEQPFMDALQDHPELEFILCLHEGVAVSMADAYARATGKPAFVQLHIAPGLGNAIGMIFNATSGHAPLVVYAGQSSTDTLFQEPLLSGDLVGMARPVTKWAFEVGHAADQSQRGIALRLGQLPLVDLLAERLLETLHHPVRPGLGPAAEDDLVAVLAGHLGDAGTHGPGADDPDALDVHGALLRRAPC